MLFAPRYAGPPRELAEDGYAIEIEPGTYTVCLPALPCQPVIVPPGGVAVAGADERKIEGGTTE
jgi:hypothetical protein